MTDTGNEDYLDYLLANSIVGEPRVSLRKRYMIGGAIIIGDRYLPKTRTSCSHTPHTVVRFGSSDGNATSVFAMRDDRTKACNHIIGYSVLYRLLPTPYNPF